MNSCLTAAISLSKEMTYSVLLLFIFTQKHLYIQLKVFKGLYHVNALQVSNAIPHVPCALFVAEHAI